MAAVAMQSQVRLATQKGRLLEVTTPLPFDSVVINSFSGSESISGMFHFNLELLASEPVAMDKLLSQGILTTMKTGEAKRPFHGIVSHISCSSQDDLGVWRYQAEVVPWLWLLTQKSTSRVFQNQSVVEIVTNIFDDLEEAFADLVSYEDRTMPERHIALDYCVQYRETDFNFVSRLMEQEGIFYYFEHTSEKHTLVLSDCNTAIPSKAINARYIEGGTGKTGEFVTHWNEGLEVRPARYSMRDHHFQLPNQPLDVTVGDPNHPLEVYDYPGGYAARFKEPDRRLGHVTGEGDKLVAMRMDEEELPGHVFSGSSICSALGSGQRLSLTDHRSSSGKYIITSVNHSAGQNPDYVSGHNKPGTRYHNKFTCVPASAKIRPARVTPKPFVAGPQTAVVAVKPGEESWLDKFGRVRVQFHWQRNPDGTSPVPDQDSTCWVRVAQSWAGTSWGVHFWPRVGQEVVVNFLEGDPDRPIITGSVYNAANMPPYALPENYTRSGIVTRSSKNGGRQNFNELRFEDKSGQEQIFLNAEKDMDHRVEQDHRIFVGADQHLVVSGLQNEFIGTDHSRQVVGNHMEVVGAKFSLQVGGSKHQTVNNIYTLQAGDEIHLLAGSKIVIEAGHEVSIKGPGGFINIDMAGITIEGTTVNVNCGGSPVPGTQALPEQPFEPDIADDGSAGTRLSSLRRERSSELAL